MSLEQQSFIDAVYSREAALNMKEASEIFVESPRLELGLRAYHTNYFLGLTLGMKSRFQKMELLLGSEAFNELVEEFIVGKKLMEYDVDLFGVGFSAFLEQHRKLLGQHADICIDMAKFEEYKFLSIHTKGVLGPVSLHEVQEETGLKINSQCFFLRSDFDLGGVYAALLEYEKNPGSSDVDLRHFHSPTYMLIGRNDLYESKVLELNRKVDPLLQALEQGTNYLKLLGTCEQASLPAGQMVWLLEKLAKGGWLEIGG